MDEGMEEGKGERYLASGRQYGNALLGVRHQEENKYFVINRPVTVSVDNLLRIRIRE